MILAVGNLFMMIRNINGENKMKKVIGILSLVLLLTVACKEEAVEAAPVEEVKAVEEVKEAVEEVLPAESVE